MTDNTIQASGVPDSSPLRFYGAMSLSERRTFWGCAAEWTLDGMDFMIYPFVLGTLVNLWHVDPSKAALAATSTLLASAVGGWAAGYLCDRIGRVLTLQITIAGYPLSVCSTPLRKTSISCSWRVHCWGSASAANGPRARS